LRRSRKKSESRWEKVESRKVQIGAYAFRTLVTDPARKTTFSLLLTTLFFVRRTALLSTYYSPVRRTVLLSTYYSPVRRTVLLSTYCSLLRPQDSSTFYSLLS
jgi:hypothetical protein